MLAEPRLLLLRALDPLKLRSPPPKALRLPPPLLDTSRLPILSGPLDPPNPDPPARLLTPDPVPARLETPGLPERFPNPPP